VTLIAKQIGLTAPDFDEQALATRLEPLSFSRPPRGKEAQLEVDDPGSLPELLEKIRRHPKKEDGLLDSRSSSIKAIGRLGDEDAVPDLLDIIDDSGNDDHIKNDAVWALWQIGSTIVVPRLLDAFPRQAKNVQAIIVPVLGLFGDQRSTDTLARLLTDGRPTYEGIRIGNGTPMCEIGEDALARIGTSEALTAIGRGPPSPK